MERRERCNKPVMTGILLPYVALRVKTGTVVRFELTPKTISHGTLMFPAKQGWKVKPAS